MLAPAKGRFAIGLDMLRLLTFIVPASLLLGALGSQFIGGLHPCEMCIWQRWPHALAIGVVLVAMLLHGRPELSRKLTLVAAVLIGISGLIGVFHAGVEQDWWEGLTTCSSGLVGSMDDLLNATLVRCDEIPWSWMGISLAGWNAIVSLGASALILFLGTRKVTA